jgi:hypothetical protein
MPLLDRLRNCRNDCAHPTGIFITPEEAMELAESIGSVVSRQVINERLMDGAIWREFARVTGEPEGRAIAPWVQDALCPQLMHDLLTIFERNDEVDDISGIVGLWQGMWGRVDDLTRQRLWDRLEKGVRNTLDEQEKALRSPEDWVRWIVWPDPGDTHPSRDRIGQMLTEWIEQRAQSGEFTVADMELARKLREYLPAPLCDRLRAALQEMTRRYVE